MTVSWIGKQSKVRLLSHNEYIRFVLYPSKELRPPAEAGPDEREERRASSELARETCSGVKILGRIT